MGALLQNAAEAYAIVYFGAIIVSSVLEWALPLRPSSDALRLRWLSNFGISFVNAFIVRALFPVITIGWAAYCAERNWGLFNQLAWPAWLTVAIGIIWLDLLSYALHVVLHRVPLLWRLHRTHHTDHDYDFSTSLRAHPTETLLTHVVSFAGILVAGASPLAVFLNQLMTVVSAFIGHSNVRVSPTLDRALRWVFVTPDMHRVHHSVEIREGESNFSNLFPWWDYLFSTYVDQPAAGHEGMTFGVHGFEARKHLSLPWMLAQPFLKPDRPSDAGATADTPLPTEAARPQQAR